MRGTPDGSFLLDQEIRLIAKPAAHVVAMGKDVYSVLEQNGFNRAVTPIVHYSALAGAARNAAVAGRQK